jgi:hypothetical protein
VIEAGKLHLDPSPNSVKLWSSDKRFRSEFNTSGESRDEGPWNDCARLAPPPEEDRKHGECNQEAW